MSNFWPSGLDLSDTRSPKEILKVAQEDWRQRSDGVMELVLQDAKSTDGYIMIIVHAKHVGSNRTSTLFSILHRPNSFYPVTIQLETDELPNFLKKTYESDSSYISMRSALATIGRIGGSQTVSNPWVADTPAEFQKKLGEAFNKGSIKSIIVNLASGVSDDTIENH
jgi:hypothetical protein